VLLLMGFDVGGAAPWSGRHQGAFSPGDFELFERAVEDACGCVPGALPPIRFRVAFGEHACLERHWNLPLHGGECPFVLRE